MPRGVYIRTEITKQRMSIAHMGLHNHNFGKHLSKKIRQKIRDSKLGKPRSAEVKSKIGRAQVGILNHNFGKVLSEETRCKLSRVLGNTKNPMYGKTHSKEVKQRMRQCALMRIQKDGTSKIGMHEKQILDQQEQVDHVTMLRQYPIQKLGYIVDGYCPETNTVYEVYEKHHKKFSQQQRDTIRQQEIQSLLGCRFVIIWDI